MPKAELRTFGVVAGEELKKIPGGGCFSRRVMTWARCAPRLVAELLRSNQATKSVTSDNYDSE
jgi:hypothetical protein